MTRNDIEEILEDAIFWDGLDDAIIGIADRIGLSVVAYDVEKILQILMETMEVDESDLEEGESIEGKKYEMANEYYEFNILGAWVGEMTPIHIRTNE
jgi:hypothetical protein